MSGPEEGRRKRAASRLRAQEPGQGPNRVARHARPERTGGAEHRLAIGVAALRAAAPPARGLVRIALYGYGIVVEYADPRHRRGNALLGRRQRPAMSLRRIARDALAFEQHPAQHILRGRIALLGGGTVELGGACVVQLDAFALEVDRR